jgi:hypothetical protein
MLAQSGSGSYSHRLQQTAAQNDSSLWNAFFPRSGPSTQATVQRQATQLLKSRHELKLSVSDNDHSEYGKVPYDTSSCTLNNKIQQRSLYPSIRSGDILRLRERKRPSDPAGDRDRPGLCDAGRDSLLPSCEGDKLRLLLRADGLRELRLPSRLVLRLRPLVFSSFLPSMAASNRL